MTPASRRLGQRPVKGGLATGEGRGRGKGLEERGKEKGVRGKGKVSLRALSAALTPGTRGAPGSGSRTCTSGDQGAPTGVSKHRPPFFPSPPAVTSPPGTQASGEAPQPPGDPPLAPPAFCVGGGG